MNDYFDYLNHLSLESLRKELKEAIDNSKGNTFILRRVIPRIMKLIALKKADIPKYNQSRDWMPNIKSALRKYEDDSYRLASGDDYSIRGN